MPNCSAGFEAMRQFFMSRAVFWSHMMRAMADLATYAAGVAAEARKAPAMMGPGGSNFFALPGGPYGRPPDGELDLDKLKQSLGDLKGLDQAQAAKILYAVQLVQSMEAWRKSSPPGGQAASQTGW